MIALLLFAAAAVGPPNDKPKMGPIEKEHKIVVDAVRGCHDYDDEEIVICSSDRGVAEGYRLPKLDTRFAGALAKNGRSQLTDVDLGASGAGSCSATGAGGATGCSKREYDNWAKWKQEQKKAAHAYEDPN